MRLAWSWLSSEVSGRRKCRSCLVFSFAGLEIIQERLEVLHCTPVVSHGSKAAAQCSFITICILYSTPLHWTDGGFISQPGNSWGQNWAWRSWKKIKVVRRSWLYIWSNRELKLSVAQLSPELKSFSVAPNIVLKPRYCNTTADVGLAPGLSVASVFYKITAFKYN